MTAGTEQRSEESGEPVLPSRPRVSACKSCPEKRVFIESGNTDGWIATDTVVPVDK